MIKRLFIIAAFALAAAVNAGAQEYSATEQEGKGGWFAGGGVGVNIGADGLRGSNPSFSVGIPAIQAYGGKWFSPIYGARFGLQGLHAAGFYGHKGFNFLSTPIDLFVNIPGVLFGWTKDNFFNAYPYVSVVPSIGIPSGYGSIGGGAGLLSVIQGPWSAYVDLRGTIAGEAMTGIKGQGIFGMASVTAGVHYDFDYATVAAPASSASTGSAAPVPGSDFLSKIAAQGLEEPKPEHSQAALISLGDYTGGVKGVIINRSTK